MKSKVLISKNPLFQSCPACSRNNSLHHSHPRTLKEKAFKINPVIKLYRCRECGWRGFLSSYNITVASLRALFYYFILIVIAAVLALEILKRIF